MCYHGLPIMNCIWGVRKLGYSVYNSPPNALDCWFNSFRISRRYSFHYNWQSESTGTTPVPESILTSWIYSVKGSESNLRWILERWKPSTPRHLRMMNRHYSRSMFWVICASRLVTLCCKYGWEVPQQSEYLIISLIETLINQRNN